MYLDSIFVNIAALPVFPSPPSPESNVVVYSKESLIPGRLWEATLNWGKGFSDHSPFLGTESSFYRRSKINKYTRRLLKTRRGRLDITFSITQDDSPRMTRWGTITWRELLHETRWLDEDDSTRVTRRGDDSKRTTRRGSHDEARWFDETTLSHNQNPRSSQGCLWGTSVLRIVLTSLFIYLFFQSFEMFSLLLMTFMANPLFLLL